MPVGGCGPTVPAGEHGHLGDARWHRVPIPRYRRIGRRPSGIRAPLHVQRGHVLGRLDLGRPAARARLPAAFRRDDQGAAGEVRGPHDPRVPAGDGRGLEPERSACDGAGPPHRYSLPIVTAPQGYRIEAFEPTELAPRQLREAALFEQALQHERVPEDPLMDPVAIEARFRASAPGQWRAFSGARDKSGAVVGYSGVFWGKNEPGNQHLRWCEIAVAPAGYRLERVDGVVPDKLVRPYIESASGMNDAPRGDLRMDDWELTEEQIRDRESWQQQAGIERWLIVAVHEASGAGAGFTEVTYDPRVPHLIWQQGTA